MNRWLRKGANWGPGAARRIYSDDHWQKPIRWNDAAAKSGARPKVFPSVCDPMDNAAPDMHRPRFGALITATPNLTWLLLTKRIGNAKETFREMFGTETPPDNVWLGATIVNQEEADRDIPKLLATPARVRFLSMEPLLGPVELPGLRHTRKSGAVESVPLGALLNWVIVGGESGHGARPMHPDWARSLRDQCAAAGVPFLFKQWGEFADAKAAGLDLNACYEKARTGGWIEMSGAFSLGEGAGPAYSDAAHVFRVGKSAAGRVLDGRTHDGFPEVACAT